MSRSTRRNLWLLGGVVFLGVAVVAATVSAWAGMVSGLLLAAIQFVIAARLPVEPAE